MRAGKVRIVYRAVETATRDPQTFQTQQVAALAAGKQNHFWDYAEGFYRQQGTEGTGLRDRQFPDGRGEPATGAQPQQLVQLPSRSDPALIKQVQSEQQAARAAGVQGTPTLILQGPRGKAQPPETAPSYDQLEQMIKSVA